MEQNGKQVLIVGLDMDIIQQIRKVVLAEDNQATCTTIMEVLHKSALDSYLRERLKKFDQVIIDPDNLPDDPQAIIDKVMAACNKLDIPCETYQG